MPKLKKVLVTVITSSQKGSFPEICSLFMQYLKNGRMNHLVWQNNRIYLRIQTKTKTKQLSLKWVKQSWRALKNGGNPSSGINHLVWQKNRICLRIQTKTKTKQLSLKWVKQSWRALKNGGNPSSRITHLVWQKNRIYLRPLGLLLLILSLLIFHWHYTKL